MRRIMARRTNAAALRAAPSAPSAPSPKPFPVFLQQAEALRDNQKACRHAAQQICRAGVKSPRALTPLQRFTLKLFGPMDPAHDSDNQQHSPARYKLEEVRCRSRSALISSITSASTSPLLSAS